MKNRRSSSRADRFPWLLAAGPALVVVASFVTFAIAATHEDRLVARNYYKLGLTINRTLAAEPVRVSKGEATVTIGAAGEVRVSLQGMTTSSLALGVHAPGDHGDAKPLALRRSGDTEWTGVLRSVAPGRNIVVLTADGWQLPVTLVERLPATVHLRAESAPS